MSKRREEVETVKKFGSYPLGCGRIEEEIKK